MMPSLSATLLALALLSALPASADPPPLPSCAAGVRFIELVADATDKPPELCIRPGRTTTIHFDSRRVRFEWEKRWFHWVLEGENALAFAPSEALRDGERLPLTVYFEDGAAPESAAFVLVVHPSQAEGQVEVSRHPRPAGSYREEAKQAREEARQCQREKAHLQAECRGRAGLTGLIAPGLVSGEGVASRNLFESVTGSPGDTLTPTRVLSYRSATQHEAGGERVLRLAVELKLENRGATPWTVAGAALLGPKGKALRVLEVWQPEPMPPGEWRTVVVEVEATEGEVQGPFTLKLWAEGEEAGSVTFRGITFP
jgi:uncharacterized protein (TIGR02268 family)